MRKRGPGGEPRGQARSPCRRGLSQYAACSFASACITALARSKSHGLVRSAKRQPLAARSSSSSAKRAPRRAARGEVDPGRAHRQALARRPVEGDFAAAEPEQADEEPRAQVRRRELHEHRAGQVGAPARPLEAERQTRARRRTRLEPGRVDAGDDDPLRAGLERAREPGGRHGGDVAGNRAGADAPGGGLEPVPAELERRPAGEFEAIADRDRWEPSLRGRRPARGPGRGSWCS